jgi:hypothetical protein
MVKECRLRAETYNEAAEEKGHIEAKEGGKGKYKSSGQCLHYLASCMMRPYPSIAKISRHSMIGLLSSLPFFAICSWYEGIYTPKNGTQHGLPTGYMSQSPLEALPMLITKRLQLGRMLHKHASDLPTSDSGQE